MKTILVKIAAYRDDELPKTLESLLTHAKHANRLRFAIVHQYGPETRGIINKYKTDPRFRIIEQPWREARGVGLARAMSDSLYRGEDFYLQIDSHMRFEPNWDERMIVEWRKCHDEWAILSSYPPAYRYDEHDKEIFVKSDPNRLVVHDMFMGDIPTFFGKALTGYPDAPSRAAFVAGGLQFGPGRACEDIPYESKICFIGEEIVHSLRLFAAGYHIYSPVDQVVSHLYIRSKHQKNAHHFWKDFTEDEELADVYHGMNATSYEVVRQYLRGENIVDRSDVWRFENFAGVDFGARKIHANTYDMPTLPMAGELDDSWRASAIKPHKFDQ